MLQAFRTHKRWLMFIAMVLIIPSFVVTGIYSYSRMSTDDNAIARVGEVPILPEQFDMAQRQQLQRQIEVALEVGGIDHVNQHVGVAAQDVVAGNLLVQRGLRGDGGQGVGSREVDQRDLVVSGGEYALFTLNGDPGPVAHALASPGQLVKKRSLAGIRIAN